MRATIKATAYAFAALMLAFACAPRANAQCAYPLVWRTPPDLPSPSVREPEQLRVNSPEAVPEREGSDDRIVGFWKVKLVSEGNPGIPDGALLDNAFAQWHSDGTEIMNSSRPPATGNFCLGVWQKNGPSSYDLNHFALSSDPAGNMVGPAQIREHVTLDQKGRTFAGTFTIDQYDLFGNLLAHVAGQVTGTRIAVDTQVGDVL